MSDARCLIWLKGPDVGYLFLVRSMTSADKKSRRSSFLGAALFFCIGVMMLLRGYDADVHHTFIAGGGKIGWMNPWQAYAASAVCFGITAYAMVLAFRKRNSGSGPPR